MYSHFHCSSIVRWKSDKETLGIEKQSGENCDKTLETWFQVVVRCVIAVDRLNPCVKLCVSFLVDC